jgi:hypothetical protein
MSIAITFTKWWQQQVQQMALLQVQSKFTAHFPTKNHKPNNKMKKL